MSDWKNVQYKDGKMRTSSGGGGGGASALADLDDVDLSNLADGDTLIYDDQNQKWVNGAGGSSGGSSITALSTDAITDSNSHNLSSAITNFDLILIHAYYTGGDGYPLTGSAVVSVTQLINHSYRIWIDGGNNDRAIQVQFPTTSTVKMLSTNGSNGIQGVYGINFTSGGVSNNHTYSTQEQVVGTWIDGKPIYEKTISPLTTTSGTYALDISSLSLNEIIDFKIFIHNSTGGDYAFGSYWEGSTDKLNFYMHSSKRTIYIRSASGYSYGTGWCVLQYTKTTD